jgi:hypothetical protein
MKSARIGASDALAEGVQLEKGASPGTLELTLDSASAQLEGTVSDDDGFLVGAKVRLTPDPETPYSRTRTRSTRTDQAGHFLLAGLAPGKYRVVATSPLASDGSSYHSESKALTLSESEQKTLPVKLVKPQD